MHKVNRCVFLFSSYCADNSSHQSVALPEQQDHCLLQQFLRWGWQLQKKPPSCHHRAKRKVPEPRPAAAEMESQYETGYTTGDTGNELDRHHTEYLYRWGTNLLVGMTAMSVWCGLLVFCLLLTQEQFPTRTLSFTNFNYMFIQKLFHLVKQQSCFLFFFLFKAGKFCSLKMLNISKIVSYQLGKCASQSFFKRRRKKKLYLKPMSLKPYFLFPLINHTINRGNVPCSELTIFVVFQKKILIPQKVASLQGKLANCLNYTMRETNNYNNSLFGSASVIIFF